VAFLAVLKTYWAIFANYARVILKIKIMPKCVIFTLALAIFAL
jgi:hypothetical protein